MMNQDACLQWRSIGNSAYDKLSGSATAKNNMVVASKSDANIKYGGTLSSVTINSSNSEGPTDDLRIKARICAVMELRVYSVMNPATPLIIRYGNLNGIALM
jgi:hypothetical protein